jgi:S-adenosyl methyltransferase
VAYIEADLREPGAILADPALRKTLDLGQPVALSVIAVLHFLTDQDDPYGCVARLVAELPPGSFVVLSHVDETLSRFNAVASSQHGAFRTRTKDEVGRFLEGTELLEPGIVSIVDWLTDEEPKPAASAAETAMYGAVAWLP